MDADIADAIRRLEVLITTNGQVDEFVPVVQELVTLAPLSLGSRYHPGAKLYRATAHHQNVPKTIAELWYPPVAKASLGRANREGQPMFYCSPDPACTFLELGARVGSLVVHAQWITKVDMLLHDLGYTAQVLTRAGARRTLPADHNSFYEKLDNRQKQVRDFLALAFTDPTSGKYAFTAAIAEVHLGAPDFSGLIYPAISKDLRVDNIALTPSFVRTGLKLETAQLTQVDQVSSDGQIGGVILCDLNKVDTDGSLHWTFRERGTSVAPGEAYACFMKPGKIIRVQGGADIQIEGRQYRVESGYSIEMSNSGEIFIRDLSGDIVKPVG